MTSIQWKLCLHNEYGEDRMRSNLGIQSDTHFPLCSWVKGIVACNGQVQYFVLTCNDVPYLISIVIGKMLDLQHVLPSAHHLQGH